MCRWCSGRKTADQRTIGGKEFHRGFRQVRVPVTGGGMVRAIGHVLHAGERQILQRAVFGERIAFHVQHVPRHYRAARLEGVPAAAHTVWQVRQRYREFEHGR